MRQAVRRAPKGCRDVIRRRVAPHLARDVRTVDRDDWSCRGGGECSYRPDSSRRLSPPLQDALGPFEFTSSACGEAAATTVNEVLNHANGRSEPLRRDVLSCHRAGDLRRRSGERTRRRMRRVGGDRPDPATLRSSFRHGMNSCDLIWSGLLEADLARLPIMSSTRSWYLVLRTWSVPSPKSLVRLQRAADHGPRTTDGPSTKYPAPSTACYTKTKNAVKVCITSE